MEEKKEEQKYVNPMTGKNVDESITEKEAKERGYLEFEFMLRYLEDENEYVKYYIIDGKSVIVDMAKPHLQYKHKPNLNYERLFRGGQSILVDAPSSVHSVATVVACSMDEGCESCGS